MRVLTTPWVRDALAADPVAAMAVEARIHPLEGTLRLSGKSAGGPFTAIYHAPGDATYDGVRGSGRTVGEAVAAALREAVA